MGYQVGVTPLQMVAAVSAVANGGELVEPRVVRAVYRDNRRYAVQPKVAAPHDQRRHRGDADDDHGEVVERGTAKRAQIPGYTIAGKTGTAAKLVNGRYSHVRLQRVVRRLRAVARTRGRDHRRHRLAARPNGDIGGAVAAPIFKRIAEATLRYLGVAPTINPAPPVLVARRDEPPHVAGGRRRSIASRSSASSPTAPGTVPDLRGLSAREAVRKLVKLGLNARVSGDGFVVSQDPAAGRAARGRRRLRRIVLERSPARRATPRGTGQP